MIYFEAEMMTSDQELILISFKIDFYKSRCQSDIKSLL